MQTFNSKGYLKFWSGKIDEWLNDYFYHISDEIDGLTTAMRYSLFSGGKRIRPAIIYSSFGIFDTDFDKISPFAAAVELVHTYSLIHDDLPAMDDDDFRRGKPSSHKKFGEGTAILAGDALLTKAFEIILDKNLHQDIDSGLLIEAAYKMTLAVGDRGMILGQYADITNEGKKQVKGDDVEYIHMKKTASLISYCAELGAIIGGGTAIDRTNLKNFGEKIGLAFQITDDILDIPAANYTGTKKSSDIKKEKLTYPSIYGVEKSREISITLIDAAFAALSMYGESARLLSEIAKFIITRSE